MSGASLGFRLASFKVPVDSGKHDGRGQHDRAACGTERAWQQMGHGDVQVQFVAHCFT